MKYDVFISYSSKDQKIAEGICGYLEGNGYRCFVSYRDIPRGVVWAGAIADAIDESQMMVVVFSKDFNISPQTDREIELAAENSIPILTYRITDDKFTGAKKYYLKNLNWIDAFPNPENYFGNLMDSVCKLVRKNKENNETTHLLEKAEDYYYGRNGKTIDYIEARLLFHELARQGNPKAQYYLAEIFEKGLTNEENTRKAIFWYNKSATQGNAYAQNRLGHIYYDGTNTVINYKKAFELFIKSAEQGNVDSQYWAGHMCAGSDFGVYDIETALTLLKKAANNNHKEAAYELGNLYANGWRVLNGWELSYNKYGSIIPPPIQKPDLIESKKWYQLALNLGHPKAEVAIKRVEFQS